MELHLQDDKGQRLELNDGVALLEENRTYRLALQLGQAAREGWRAWFGDIELNWQQGSTSFELRTGHWVGNQSLRIHGPQSEHELEIEVLPRGEKLTGPAWGHLLRELNQWMPGSSVGQEGGLHGEIGFSGSNVAGIASVLGDLVPAFADALSAVIRAPRERPTDIWTEAPVHTVKQANRETLRWLVRHPDVYQGISGQEGEHLGGREPLVPLRARKADVDHAANRYAAWLVKQVTLRLRAIAQSVRKGMGKRRHSLDPDLEKWCEGRISRLEEGANQLEALWWSSPLGALMPEPAADSALLTLADDPLYARVHAFGQLFLEPRFQLPDDESLLEAPVRPSYELYELWTFLALQRALARHMKGARWLDTGVDKLRYFDQNPNGALYTAHWPGHGTLGLYFNLEFSGYLVKKRGVRWSISGARRPDLVLTWQSEVGQGRWVCLDAKYRTAHHNVADAFESAHLYKDALRWSGLGERGLCAGAMLLVPAMDPKAAPWFKPEFRNEHGVGVFCLTPGQEFPAELIAWLGETLGWDTPLAPEPVGAEK